MRNSPYMNMSIAQDLQIFLRIISDIKVLSNVSWNLNTLAILSVRTNIPKPSFSDNMTGCLGLGILLIML